jgi:transglutaminase-like putative cysteine protease
MSLGLRVLFTTAFVFISLSLVSQPGNVILDYETHIEVKPKELIIERSFLIQINEKSSNWIAEVEIHYNDEDKLEILEASILDANGNEQRKLKKKEFTDVSDRSRSTFYQDNLVKQFSLNWHQYPYQIRYSYRKVLKKYIYVADWTPLYYYGVPVVNSSLKIDIPADLNIRLDYDDVFKYSKVELNGFTRHQWEKTLTDKLVREELAPPPDELLPHVTAIPEKFIFSQEGSLESWSKYGEWVSRINEGMDELPADELERVKSMVSGVESTEEKVKILYHYLQDNTRYINVSIDEGGMVPYPASYVSENKYGDCKALTIYMKGLLKAAGIDSYYSLVYLDKMPSKVDPGLPGNQFNHVILSVPIEQDTLWLENTSGISPCNYLGTSTQNRYALLVDGIDSRLVKTPVLNMEEVLEETSYHYKLDNEGNGSLKIQMDLLGDAFEMIRGLEEYYNEDDQRKFLQSLMNIRKGELKNWDFDQINRDIPGINLEANFQVKEQFRTIGKSLVLKPIPIDIFELEKPGKRNYPIRLNYPVNKKDRLIYSISDLDQYNIRLPAKVELESDFGNYTLEYKKEGKDLIISRTLRLFRGEYDLDIYPDFYSFLESIQNSNRKSAIIIEPS